MDLKTVIVYRSKHHGNTKKLVDAIVAAHPEIDTIDVGALGKNEYPDLSPYHIIIMHLASITATLTKTSCALPTTAYVTATRS